MDEQASCTGRNVKETNRMAMKKRLEVARSPECDNYEAVAVDYSRSPRFEKNHPFPKYVEICSKHYHESDFVYLADGIRHLRVNAAQIPAFDFAKSISTIMFSPFLRRCCGRISRGFDGNMVLQHMHGHEDSIQI
nr:unnamed protein product [Callosobruchus chinensis]